MKKVFMIACAVMFLGVAQNANAQLTASAGAEIALPLGDFGDFASLGAGVSAEGEFAVSDNLAVTANLGFISLFVDDELSDFFASAFLIPIHAGARYYINDNEGGLYGMAKVGVTSMSITTEDIDILGVTVEGESDSESNLSFGFGAGFLITEAIDVSASFNIITAGDDDGAEASNYFGVRGAWRFGK